MYYYNSIPLSIVPVPLATPIFPRTYARTQARTNNAASRTEVYNGCYRCDALGIQKEVATVRYYGTVFLTEWSTSTQVVRYGVPTTQKLIRGHPKGCHVAFPTASNQVQKGLHSSTEVSKRIPRIASTTPAPRDVGDILSQHACTTKKKQHETASPTTIATPTRRATLKQNQSRASGQGRPLQGPSFPKRHLWDSGSLSEAHWSQQISG